MENCAKNELIDRLRKEIHRLQGSERLSTTQRVDFGLAPLNNSFPNATFPLGVVHEFISSNPETAAATTSFVAGLTGCLMDKAGVCVWVSTQRLVNPPALKQFGIEPDRVVFVDVGKERDVLWAVEEALKCESLASVVGEVCNLDFTASRRLQLAVENSRTTGFVLRDRPRDLNPNACAARWKITPLAGKVPIAGMPGLGFPRWAVELLRVKNGNPGKWELEWEAGRFQPSLNSSETLILQKQSHRKAG
jgi:protein ImuA